MPQHVVTQGSRQWPQPKHGENCSAWGGERGDEKPIAGEPYETGLIAILPKV